jgi:asparagine synthase (glutamine-hydrolysing)
VTYLPDDILAKVDRATMGTSLEARVPFLDPAVYAFAWRLPMSLKIQGGRGKWVLRRLLERYLPAALFERPKMGFAVPVGAWLRGPLRAWGDDLLDETRLRREGYLDPAPIQALWRAHLTGAVNGEARLWTALMFQAWLADNPC